jgi:Uma2 family endonuclease
MGVVTSLRSEGFTRADLDAMPDDGRRYELIDGAIFVTPSPSRWHQTVAGNLYLLLRAACPPGHQVLLAPFDVVLAEKTVVEPDLLLARHGDLTDKDLPVAPILAVEILSPTTRLVDLNVKKERYRTAGCAHYWVIDPLAPSVTAWHLRGGAYVEVATAEGDEPFRVDSPLEIDTTPRRLLDI